MALARSMVWAARVYGVLAVPPVLCVKLAIFVVNVLGAAIKSKRQVCGVAVSFVLRVAAYGLQFAVVRMLAVISRPFGTELAIVTDCLIMEVIRVRFEGQEVLAHPEPKGFWGSDGLLMRAGTDVAHRTAEEVRAESGRRVRELRAVINARVESSPASGDLHRREGLSAVTAE